MHGGKNRDDGVACRARSSTVVHRIPTPSIKYPPSNQADYNRMHVFHPKRWRRSGPLHKAGVTPVFDITVFT